MLAKASVETGHEFGEWIPEPEYPDYVRRRYCKKCGMMVEVDLPDPPPDQVSGNALEESCPGPAVAPKPAEPRPAQVTRSLPPVTKLPYIEPDWASKPGQRRPRSGKRG